MSSSTLKIRSTPSTVPCLAACPRRRHCPLRRLGASRLSSFLCSTGRCEGYALYGLGVVLFLSLSKLSLELGGRVEVMFYAGPGHLHARLLECCGGRVGVGSGRRVEAGAEAGVLRALGRGPTETGCFLQKNLKK